MALQRDFMMNSSDFLNLFSSAYIASRRDKINYFSDYYLVNIPANNKNALFLKFDIKEEGWFDFCIKQFDDYRTNYQTMQSRYQGQSNSKSFGVDDDGKRFLKVKFILVKDNSTGRGSTRSDPEYNAPQYDVYQIEYLHGYNRGDARFQNIMAGTYYLRIKTQKVDKSVNFVVNYSSNNKVTMQQVQLTKQQRSAILRQAMASMIG